MWITTTLFSITTNVDNFLNLRKSQSVDKNHTLRKRLKNLFYPQAQSTFTKVRSTLDSTSAEENFIKPSPKIQAKKIYIIVPIRPRQT